MFYAITLPALIRRAMPYVRYGSLMSHAATCHAMLAITRHTLMLLLRHTILFAITPLFALHADDVHFSPLIHVLLTLLLMLTPLLRCHAATPPPFFAAADAPDIDAYAIMLADAISPLR